MQKGKPAEVSLPAPEVMTLGRKRIFCGLSLFSGALPELNRYTSS